MPIAANRVAEALRAAEIPEDRQGAARVSQLSRPKRGFYFWILRQFAVAALPSAEATRAAVVALDLDPGEALAVLARDDLVHADSNGQPTVAYPFSANERGHTVLIDGTHDVQAMCAIDALGIAPMLNLPTTIVAHDLISGTEIRVHVGPDLESTWQPQGAVVLAGSTCCDGPSFRGCCDVLNFFETQENAERYLRDHPEISGTPISIAEAIEAGRVVFGDVLKEG
jgi:alkylmercury lyase-like protein